MARHETAAHPGADRLAALGLSAAAPGWVPETTEQHEPVVAAAPPAAASPGATPADLARGWAKDRTPPWLHTMVDRATVGSVLTGVATVAAVLVALFMLVHRQVASSGGSTYPASTSTSVGGPSTSGTYPATTAQPATTDATSIVVDVGGRVRKPGLVTLPPGARVADAVAAAGGPLHHRELAATNLAARVTDGQLLVIGMRPATAPAGTDTGTPTAPSSSAPVDLNSATLDQLETLPGIGPVTGQKIIAWRDAHSGFTSVEQLQQVSGIGPATYAELSPFVVP